MSQVVVIPIISPKIEGVEFVSLKRGLRVFKRYHIIYLCSDTIDTTFYELINKEYGVPFQKKVFPSHCFDGTRSYNQLCLNVDFYKAFIDFDYMLIYQLDAFVFRDELLQWCDKDYDFIGGPWLCPWSNDVENINHWEVGNGGFCLRKVKTFIDILSDRTKLKKPLKSYQRFCFEQQRRILKHPGLRLWYFFRAKLGYHNTLAYYIKHEANEDKIFAQCQYNGLMKMPSAQEALSFSFDMRPATCYAFTKGQLPFGCHMWYKYGNDDFWSSFICDNSNC